MEWKTFSVEAGDRFSKQASRTLLNANRARSLTQQKVSGDCCAFDSGMQKDGLTMFRLSCYSYLVPRVHPSLLCAVSSAKLCGCLRQSC